MKDYISYYYHLTIEDIRLIDGKYFFHDLKYRYMLEPVFFSIEYVEELYRLQHNYLSSVPFYHLMIKNTYGSVLTPIEHKNYVLLRLSAVPFETISIFDLKKEWSISFPMTQKSLNVYFPWAELWERKIDLFEESFFNEKGLSLVDSTLLEYFIGLGENAILYLKETLKVANHNKDFVLCPSHRRVFSKMSLVEFYDPLNLILDLRVRDIAEYLKDCFWSSIYDLKEVEDFILQASFTKIEAQLFFSRLLFPSFFFDCLEEKKSPKYMVDRVEEYQFFVTDIYQILREHYFVEEIRWLKKKV